MKATELLQKQHRDIEALLEKLHGAGQGDERGIRQELAANLVAHTAIEEETFYPAVKEAMPEDILEAYEEHGLADIELARLLATRGGDASFEAKAAVLSEVVLAHIRKEESNVFKAAERELGDETLNALGDKMQQRFRQVIETGFTKILQRAIEETVPRTTGRAAATKKTAARPAAAAKKKTARAAAAAQSKRTTKRRAPTTRAPAKRGSAAGARGSAGGARKGQTQQTQKQTRGTRGTRGGASRTRP